VEVQDAFRPAPTLCGGARRLYRLRASRGVGAQAGTLSVPSDTAGATPPARPKDVVPSYSTACRWPIRRSAAPP
jgi:hypothetical protein